MIKKILKKFFDDKFLLDLKLNMIDMVFMLKIRNLALISLFSLSSFAGSAQSSGDCSNGGNLGDGYGGPGILTELADWFINMIRSKDPNDIQGPVGVGAKRWVSAKEKIPYTIRFENDAQFADAPAQRVAIRCPIHTKLDINSVRLGDFGFSKLNFTIPANLSTYSAVLQTSDSLGVNVNVFAGIDVVNKEVFWLLTALDPITGQPVTDPTKGFLPINDTVTTGVGKGEGFVTYTVLPKATVVTGDTVGAQASIVFDVNGALLTNREVHTLDALPPTSQVVQLLPVSARRFNLKFSGQDDPGGVGLQDYDLYIREDSDSVRLVTSRLSGPQFPFEGKPGSRYAFFTLARDSVGNLETFKTTPDGVTQISLDTLNQPPSFVKSGIQVYRLDSAVCASHSVSICFSVTDPDTNLSTVLVDLPGSKGSAFIQQNGNQYCLNYTANASASGQDSVLVLACDSAGACDSLWVGIRIIGITVARLSPQNDTLLCPGSTLLLNANTGSSLAYAWYRNGNPIAGANTGSLTVSEAGEYYLLLTDSCGSDTSNHIRIAYPALVKPVISSTSNPVCQGQSATLSTPPQPGNQYEWSRNDTLLVGSASPSLIATLSGHYQVQLFQGNCRLKSDSFLLQVLPIPPPPTITQTGSNPLCFGDSLLLTSSAIVGNLWSTGDTTRSIKVRTAQTVTVSARNGSCFSAASTPVVVQITNPGTVNILPAGGTFSAPVQITISATIPGAAILYTTDGSDPRNGNPTTFVYSGPISLNTTTTIKSAAWLNNCQGPVRAQNFTFSGTAQQVAKPELTPQGGTYSTPQTISISTSTPGATIYYTTSGNVPVVGTVFTQQYTGPFTILDTLTVRAIAVKSGMTNSPVAVGFYNISQPGVVKQPVISPNGGNFNGSVTVSLSTVTPGATIYYTTSGNLPVIGTGFTKPYVGPFTLYGTATIRAMAVKTGLVNSSIAVANFVVNNPDIVAAPSFTPGPGNYPGAISVTISSTTPGAQIFYSTNGVTPSNVVNTNSRPYTGPILVNRNLALKAIAYKDGFLNSVVTVGSYTFGALRQSTEEAGLIYLQSDSNLKETYSISVSPNPGPGRFKVGTAGQKETARISVRNVLGQLLFEQSIQPDQPLIEIDLTKFAAGIYSLSYREGERWKEVKVVKE